MDIDSPTIDAAFEAVQCKWINVEDLRKMHSLAVVRVNGTAYCFQSQVNEILYRTHDCASVRKLLRNFGLLSCRLKIDGTHEQFEPLQTVFGQTLPPLASIALVRQFTLIPTNITITLARHRRHLPLLRAFGERTDEEEKVPDGGEEEEDEAEPEEEQDEDDEDEELDQAMDVAFVEELRQDFVPFRGPATKAPRDIGKMYALKKNERSKKLLDQIAEWRQFRLSARHRLRTGTRVVETTFDSDVSTVYRFLGFVKRVLNPARREGAVAETLPLNLDAFLADDFGETWSGYLDWLDTRQVSHATLANYSNCALNALAFVYRHDEDGSYNTSIVEVTRLRNQCEKEGREDRMYAERHPQWLSWEQVQQCRLEAETRFNETPATAMPREKAEALRNWVIIAFHSVTPPDRVGVIRKLRLQHTLVPENSLPNSPLLIDLRHVRRAHKTAKFKGPQVWRISEMIARPLRLYLDLYRECLLQGHEDPGYLFFESHDNRCASTGTWTKMVKAAFASVSEKTPPPKLLRSIFITWLRGRGDTLPAVLKASAILQRHTEATSASLHYDIEAHERQVVAAREYCERFAIEFAARAAAVEEQPPPEPANREPELEPPEDYGGGLEQEPEPLSVVEREPTTALLPAPRARQPSEESFAPEPTITAPSPKELQEQAPKERPLPEKRALPPGWEVEVRIRQSGKSAGTKDKYYISPNKRHRCRSLVEVMKTAGVTESAHSCRAPTPRYEVISRARANGRVDKMYKLPNGSRFRSLRSLLRAVGRAEL